MIRTIFLGSAIAVTIFSVVAHAEVSDPDVKARMAAMKTIGQNTKTLGDMAKGAIAFDETAAKAAAAAIAEQAAAVPALFEPHADDPESKAKATIWQNYDDFTAKAKELETAATEASMSIASAADLGPALGALGEGCKGCHSEYRAK